MRFVNMQYAFFKKKKDKTKAKNVAIGFGANIHMDQRPEHKFKRTNKILKCRFRNGMHSGFNN